MKGKRRRFTAEFKEEAVRLLMHSGRPLAQVARELGVHASVLHKWKTAVETSSDMTLDSDPAKASLEKTMREIADEAKREGVE